MSKITHHNNILDLVVRFIVLAGKLIGSLLPFYNKSGLFFFFPFYHTGGAEQVHSQIVTCFKDRQPWVFFAKRSVDARFYQQFTQTARCFDIGWLLKYSYPLSVGILAGLIGKHPNSRVFGCNSLFYYLLLPHLADHVRATDLLHALGGGAEKFALPVLDRLQKRVVISAAVRDELILWYRKEGVSEQFDSRITVIPNRVSLPAEYPAKPVDSPLQVLFVGRGSDEKRIHLIIRAARLSADNGLNLKFLLVGDIALSVIKADTACCSLSGSISDPERLAKIYADSHLILITSSREGFPLTLMEGMAYACVPVCTAVGGIPEHIRHLENGWLLPDKDEDAVVTALYDAIIRLHQDRDLLERLAVAAYRYARSHFSGERFCEQYNEVISGSADLS